MPIGGGPGFRYQVLSTRDAPAETGTMSDQPLISIDVVALRLDRATKSVDVVLAERVNPPSAGEPALPGVLLLLNELLDDAVHRALSSKAGITSDHVLATGDVGVFDTPGRDPRGPTLSITRYAIVASDFEPTAGVACVHLADATGLPFDHDLIIRRAARIVHDKLWLDRGTTAALLGPSFTTLDAADAQDSLAAHGEPLAPRADRSNLARALKRSPWLGESAVRLPTGEGRQARTWDFLPPAP